MTQECKLASLYDLVFGKKSLKILSTFNRPDSSLIPFFKYQQWGYLPFLLNIDLISPSAGYDQFIMLLCSKSDRSPVQMHWLSRYHFESGSLGYAEFPKVLPNIQTARDLFNNHSSFRFHIF